MSTPDRAQRNRLFPSSVTAVALLLLAGCDRSDDLASMPESGAANTGGGIPAPKGPNLGQPLSAALERQLDITIMPDGTGLPVGSGDAIEGARLFEEQCESCHGNAGASPAGQIPALTGGIGSLKSSSPIRTVNSYWPYAPLVFDYVRRTMPPTKPGSLTADQTYSLVAFILSVDGIVARSKRVDQTSLAKVRMPNRNGFVSE